MTSPLPEHLYVDTPEKLQQLCLSLESKSYLAIDTEFLRERTYRPQLCLIQIKSEEVLACVDSLAIDDLSPLLEVLSKPSITKVLHAASQDLEIFYLLTKAVPTPIFDTQLAAPLLGYNEQIGYGNLVSEHLGIELSKAHTRSDWTRRPLPPQQIAYALDDVVYLEQLYLDMRKQLSKLGRLDWLAPEFSAIENPKKYDQPANERWLKVRNIQRYKGATLSAIQALAEWREIKAREINQPRNWLIKDDTLSALAQQQPHNVEELEHMRGLDRKTRERFGKELIDIIQKAQDTTPLPLPPAAKKHKLTDTKQARVVLLNAWAHHKAAQLNINPSILAPVKLLEKCVTSSVDETLQGWREPLLADDFRAILNGKKGVSIDKTGLKLQDC